MQHALLDASVNALVTPSMLAISSCVITSSLPRSRSRLSSNQRHNCWSSEWCRLHTAVCAICVISAWV
jgi:hypothetical protein